MYSLNTGGSPHLAVALATLVPFAFAVQAACLLIRKGYTTSTTKHIRTAGMFGVRQCNNVFLMYVSLRDADARVGRATLGFNCTP